MALIKNHVAQKIEELPTFSTLDEAIKFFKYNTDLDKKYYVIEEISKLAGGLDYLLSYLADDGCDQNISTRIATVISALPPQKAPVESIMNLLKLKNAYVRNLGISMLTHFGSAIKYHIVKFLIGDDKDLRIFAINVLGDVNFPESREMLVELLETERNINVAMTAVDYMAEIGKPEDIPLLESVKQRFKGEFYAEFAVDNAIHSIQG